MFLSRREFCYLSVCAFLMCWSVIYVRSISLSYLIIFTIRVFRYEKDKQMDIVDTSSEYLKLAF